MTFLQILQGALFLSLFLMKERHAVWNALNLHMLRLSTYKYCQLSCVDFIAYLFKCGVLQLVALVVWNPTRCVRFSKGAMVRKTRRHRQKESVTLQAYSSKGSDHLEPVFNSHP